MAYTDATAIAHYLKRPLTADETAIVPDLILAAKNFIDDRAGRTFEKVTEARYFNADERQNPDPNPVGGPPRNRLLFIDDCLAITKIELIDWDGTVLDEYDPDDYVTYPLNGSGPNNAFNQIYLRAGAWPSGRKSLKITADWGYSETVLPEVKVAAGRIVAEALSGLGAGGQRVKKKQLGRASTEYFEEMSGDLETIINQYVPKRVRIYA